MNAILRAIVSEGPYFIVYLGVMPEYSRIFDGYVSAIEIWVAATYGSKLGGAGRYMGPVPI